MDDPKTRATNQEMAFDEFDRLDTLKYECRLHDDSWSGSLEREKVVHRNAMEVPPYDLCRSASCCSSSSGRVRIYQDIPTGSSSQSRE